MFGFIHEYLTFSNRGFGFLVSGSDFGFWVRFESLGCRVERVGCRGWIPRTPEAEFPAAVPAFGCGFRVKVITFSGFGLRVSDFGFRVSGFGFRFQESGVDFRFSEFGFGVKSVGCRVNRYDGRFDWHHAVK